MAGPIIRHDELFGFEDFRKGLKDLESGLKEFGSSVDQTIKNINSNIKDLKGFFADTAAVLKATNLSMVGAKDSLQKYNEEIETTRAENEKLKSSGEGMKQMLNAQETSVAELRAEYNKLKKEYEALKPTQADYAQQVQNIDKRIAAVLPGIKNYEKALRDQKKYVDVVNDTYGQWQQRLASLKVQLVNTTGAFDPLTGKLNKNNKEAVALSTEIGHLDKVLKTADATMGVYGRNVGNYASGFSPLSNAINQITREAPNAALNMQTFFLAISNNIPALTDAITNLKAVNTELVAAGEKPKSILKAIGGALFSFQTLISLGVTLMVLYGSKIVSWIGDLFKSKKALDEATYAAKAYKDAISDINVATIKNTAGDVSKLENLRAIIMDVTKSQHARSEAAKEYNSIADEANKLDLKQLDNLNEVNKKISTQISLIEQRGLVRAAESIQAKRAEDLLLAEEKARTQAIEDQRKEQEAIAARPALINKGGRATPDFVRQYEQQGDINRRVANDPAVKKAKADLDAFMKASRNLLAGNYTASQGAENKNDKAETDAEKEAAKALKRLRDFISKQQELLKSAAELEIKENELKLAKGLITEFEFQGKKLDIIRNYVNKAIELEKKLGGNADPKRIQDFQKEAKDGELGFTKFMQDQYANRSKLAKDSIQEVVDADKKAKKAEEDLEDRLTKKFQDAQKDKLDAYLNFLQKENALEEARHGKNFAREISYLNKIIDAKKRAGEDYSKDQEARDVKLADRQHEIQQGLIQLAKDAVAAGLQIIQEQYDYSYQERIKQLEEQKTYELNLAGTNAVARANIERDFNQKIAKEKEKQAKADKAFALFGVAINTAGAIAKTIEEWGMPFALPFIGLAVAQGLIQAAVIAARPIPKYEKGTASAAAGEAIINEKGWELIERNGRMFVEGGGQPTVARMIGGEKVYPHEASKGIVDQAIKQAQSNEILNSNSASGRLASAIRAGKTNEEIRIMSEAMQKSGMSEHALRAAFKDAVKDIPVERNTWDERGYHKSREQANERVKYLNSRYSHN
jgi:hypothetical protein